VTVEVQDIPYGERIIWGATAGMLLTLRRCLLAHPRVAGDLDEFGGPGGTEA
jgi:hypothetical protein